MQLYTELVASSAVTNSLSLPLTSASARNLLIVKGSLLQIFAIKDKFVEDDAHRSRDVPLQTEATFDRRLRDNGHSSSLSDEASRLRSKRTYRARLVLISEIPLAGTVVGLCSIKVATSASGGDAVLMAYHGAKLCLAEWNPQRKALDAISIHYYEKEDLWGPPWELPLRAFVNHLEADPESRCAALKFGARNLAILPLTRANEDLQMDDWDDDLDGLRPEQKASPIQLERFDQKAYTPSFVLRLPFLESSLLQTVHFAFLHEYREPTLGILSSQQSSSSALGVKDHLAYMIFILDLKQRASTAILSVTGLPHDLFKVIALSPPVGGALLVGQNTLIHVDQSGRTNGAAVNSLAKPMTHVSLVDLSDLRLRLEGCSISQLSTNCEELLLVLNDGRLGIIDFKIDGRTVSGISVQIVADEKGGNLVRSKVNCISRLDPQLLFLGSASSDSLLLGWSRGPENEKRKRLKVVGTPLNINISELDPEKELEVEEAEDDDDLYGSSFEGFSKASNGVNKPGEIVFHEHDALLCIAPIYDTTCGRSVHPQDHDGASLSLDILADVQLTCTVGRGNAGSIAIMNRQIQPKVVGRFEFPEAMNFWTIRAKTPQPKSLEFTRSANGGASSKVQYDRFLVVAKVDIDGCETSDVYAVTAAGFETLKGTDFDPAAGYTVEAGTMGKQTRIVQVLKSDIRCYDGDLGLVQILPMLDEETGAEPRVLSASIADPFLLLIRDDGSVFLSEIQGNYELEEVEKPDGPLRSTRWVCGCLYDDRTATFEAIQENSNSKANSIMILLLSSSSALHIFAASDLSRSIFIAEGIAFIPPCLPSDSVARKAGGRTSITEMMLADIGDFVAQSPYLILRHPTNDLTIYEPILHSTASDVQLRKPELFFKLLPNPRLAKGSSSVSIDGVQPRIPAPIRRCVDVGGFSTIFLPGPSPSFLLKNSKSTPKLIGLNGRSVRGMSTFHTEGCEWGFIYVDSQGLARVSQLPDFASFADLGVSVRKMPLHHDVGNICFHPPTNTYIVGGAIMEPFALPRDDEYHREWAKEKSSFPPSMPRGVIELINPATWTVIHSVKLEPCESIESMKTLNLEISEETRERRMLVTVGTALSKGEDLPTHGRLRVFDIVTVVPEPGKPETNKKLKFVACEDIPRGGVTGLCEIGTQGLMLVAQGQKCMVRGLKEDGTLLPVAFLDMNCHITSVRELPCTGLCLMADAFKGLWFAGYTEEPYTFKLLGKSSSNLPLLVADFLPDGEDLVFVAADADGFLHILEFEPDHPKSLQGHLLIHRASFSVTPNIPTNTLLLPRTSPDTLTHSSPLRSPTGQSQILILSSPSGQIAAITPLLESTYRRLLSVTNQMAPQLVPHGGLPTKAYRQNEQITLSSPSAPFLGAESSRSVVDGTILARWTELSMTKRREIAERAGYTDVSDLRGDLQALLDWNGLGYL